MLSGTRGPLLNNCPVLKDRNRSDHDSGDNPGKAVGVDTDRPWKVEEACCRCGMSGCYGSWS